MERGFVAIDADCRTNLAWLYAVGDVTTKGGLAHTATAQGHLAAERIAGHTVPDIDYTSIPSCTYCQPQVASVGFTEAELKRDGRAYKVGRFPLSANGKAVGAGAEVGFVKVLIDEQYGEILGAHIVGAEATEMIAEMTLARTSEATAEAVLATIHAHPTYAETMFEAIGTAMGSSVHI
jgi:dihydrolipoamide dehydrogenase